MPTPSHELITPSTNLELDLESKFGKSTLSATTSSHIPFASEIREKKEHRARLAKEQAANAYSHPSSHPGGGVGAGDDFIALEDGAGDIRSEVLWILEATGRGRTRSRVLQELDTAADPDG